MEPFADRRTNGGRRMEWARILAYITGTVELLLRNEYLAAENRILRGQLKGRLKFSDAERARNLAFHRTNCAASNILKLHRPPRT